MPYGTVLKTKDGYFLVSDRAGAVAVQDQPGKITKEIERYTNPMLQEDNGRAVGAFLNSSQMNPLEVALPDDIEVVKAMLADKENGGGLFLLSGGGMAGGMFGWKLKEEEAKKLRGEE